jgi:hypothetical protein
MSVAIIPFDLYSCVHCSILYLRAAESAAQSCFSFNIYHNRFSCNTFFLKRVLEFLQTYWSFVLIVFHNQTQYYLSDSSFVSCSSMAVVLVTPRILLLDSFAMRISLSNIFLAFEPVRVV